MRFIVLTLAGLAPMLAAAAPQMSSGERAYTLTIMCTAIASEYGTDADKLRTADASRKMARAQGYDNKRLSSDVIKMASLLGGKLRDDPQALDDDRAICRKLGLVR